MFPTRVIFSFCCTALVSFSPSKAAFGGVLAFMLVCGRWCVVSPRTVKEGYGSDGLNQGRVAYNKKTEKKKCACPLKLWSVHDGGKGEEVITERAAFFSEEQTIETPSIGTNFASFSCYTLGNEDLCYWLRWMRAAPWEQMRKWQVDICLGPAHGRYIGMGVSLLDRKAH